jgi:hypothetical protein
MRYKLLFCLVAIRVFVRGPETLFASNDPKRSISKTESPQQVSERGPAATFNVAIYNGNSGEPGPTILGGPWTNVVPTIDNSGTVTLDLSPPAVLAPQVVWIVASANLESDQGQWYWNDNNIRHGAAAKWRNPGGGFGTTCSGWGSIADCLGDPAGGPDLRFQIWGRPIGQPGDPILLYGQLDGTADSAWIAQNFETAMDSYDCELGDCWGPSAPGWTVSRVVLEGTYVSAVDPCEDFSTLQARCQTGGTIQARLTLANTNHTGELVEISIDGTPHQVTVGANGRASLSVGGFNVGSHTVELTDPPGCLDPVTVRCRNGVALEGEELWNDDVSWEIPAAATLIGNYPNPFNPSTTFRYGLSEPDQVTLKVYNTLGQLVRTVVNDFQGEGYHEAVWDGRNESGAMVASGIYVYRITAGSFMETKRMILMK